jgi:hypothetical protein
MPVLSRQMKQMTEFGLLLDPVDTGAPRLALTGASLPWI